MHASRPLPLKVLDTLADGGMVLCANARAARTLSAAYGETMLSRPGQTAWRTPSILDWHAWLQAQWQRLLMTGTESRTLLTPFQEELLWTDIVRPSLENRSLVAPAQVAALARSAYGLLGTHDAFDALRRSFWDSTTQEPEIFHAWALELERRCERNDWLCEARLSDVIREAMRDGRLPMPSTILWNGFDRLTPAQLKMRTALSAGGSEVSDLAWNAAANASLVHAPNTPDEIEMCARWAAEMCRDGGGRRVAILVPQLSSLRAQLDRALRRVLQPDGVLFAGEAAAPFEFTLGTALSRIPMIEAAMTFVHWCLGPLDRQEITGLLTSGFLGEADAATPLAAADIAVRGKWAAPEMSMEALLDRLYRSSGAGQGSWHVVNWVRQIRRARAMLDGAPGSSVERPVLLSQWTALMATVLDAAGWPGSGKLDAVGFQVIERWKRALEEVSKGSFNNKRYSLRAFANILQAHLDGIIFSPESRGSAITVSGIPESAGQYFDAVWVIGMTDEAWPPRSTPHPLLPFGLQKERAMPGSSAALDQAYGAGVLERLYGMTDTLIFSYPAEGAAGEQRPNALVAGLPVEDRWNGSRARTSTDCRESFEEEMTVPWPGGYVPGGQRVLKDQSACPFQAFAAHRLKAKELPSTQPGLSAMERGTIVHIALQNLWGDEGIRNSQQLHQAIESGGLPVLIRTHVGEAFAQFEQASLNTWEREYLQLEILRVCSLLEQWLRKESERRPFRVQQREEPKLLRFENLELNVRMDRIDEVEEGLVVIDYKTGEVKKKMWEGERPDEPQLPLYAVFGGIENLHDVLFAQVTAKKPDFVSATFGNAPDIFDRQSKKQKSAIANNESFQAICEQWESALYTIAREFQSGIATVTPKQYAKTCEFCAYSTLCRIAESKSPAGFDEETDDDEEEDVSSE